MASKPRLKQFEDRIGYFDEITKDGDRLIDEVVAGNADVHLETLTDNCCMLIIQTPTHYWHLNIWHKGKSPLRITMLEDNSQ